MVRNNSRGTLIVVSAPSGGGKSTLVQQVLSKDPQLCFSVSYTTREPRGGERQGVEYHFVSVKEFNGMRDRGEFLEYAEVHGYFYGTSRKETEEILAAGYDALLDIDVQGAAQIRKSEPEAVTVFILPPSRTVLYDRLRLRNLNSSEDVERRLSAAATEVLLFNDFDYVVVNDDLTSASAALESIIVAERHRPGKQRKIAQAIIDTFGGEPFHA